MAIFLSYGTDSLNTDSRDRTKHQIQCFWICNCHGFNLFPSSVKRYHRKSRNPSKSSTIECFVRKVLDIWMLERVTGTRSRCLTSLWLVAAGIGRFQMIYSEKALPIYWVSRIEYDETIGDYFDTRCRITISFFSGL